MWGVNPHLPNLGVLDFQGIAFGVFPLFLPLAITTFGGREGRFSLAIMAFGAFEFIVPQMLLSLWKNGQEESKLLN